MPNIFHNSLPLAFDNVYREKPSSLWTVEWRPIFFRPPFRHHSDNREKILIQFLQPLFFFLPQKQHNLFFAFIVSEGARSVRCLCGTDRRKWQTLGYDSSKCTNGEGKKGKIGVPLLTVSIAALLEAVAPIEIDSATLRRVSQVV